MLGYIFNIHVVLYGEIHQHYSVPTKVNIDFQYFSRKEGLFLDEKCFKQNLFDLNDLNKGIKGERPRIFQQIC